MSNPDVNESDRLRAFREACERLGIIIPENFEALLMLAGRFKGGDRPKPG
jgi:hypothetical protein